MPATGQASKIEVEGCAQRAPNGPLPLTTVHFQDLSPLPGGGAKVNLTSQGFDLPVCGENGAGGLDGDDLPAGQPVRQRRRLRRLQRQRRLRPEHLSQRRAVPGARRRHRGDDRLVHQGPGHGQRRGALAGGDLRDGRLRGQPQRGTADARHARHRRRRHAHLPRRQGRPAAARSRRSASARRPTASTTAASSPWRCSVASARATAWRR